MKKRFLITLSLVLLILTANAQYKTVQYQYDRNWFNENNPLPSETLWMLNGNIPDGVTTVEVDVYNSAVINENKKSFSGKWQKGLMDVPSQFSIPVNYKLRGNDDYSLAIRYYKTADLEQKQELFDNLNETVLNYLRMNIAIDNNRVDFFKKPVVMYDELNQLVIDGLKLYRLGNGLEFSSFSTMVLDKLNQIKSINLNDAKDNIKSDENKNTQNLRISYFYQQFDDLVNMCNLELSQYMQSEIVYLVDTKEIINYPSEKTTKSLNVNLGYAAIYHSGEFDNLNYASAPYAGISIPFGNASMEKNFMSRSALSIGVFLKKLDFRYIHKEVGGPVIDLPIYIAYGYKPVSFMRINLGVTALQEASKSRTDFDNVYIRPFLGVAFELNVSGKFK